MSEDKTQKRISRGKRASLLMQDELLVGAFDALQAAYTKALFETHPHDGAAREKLYLAFNVVGKVRDHLSHAVSDGKISQVELDKLNSAPARE